MAQTKQEIRNAWNRAHYKQYVVNFRKEEDKQLIDYIEKRKSDGENTSEIFRQAVSQTIESGK